MWDRKICRQTLKHPGCLPLFPVSLNNKKCPVISVNKFMLACTTLLGTFKVCPVVFEGELHSLCLLSLTVTPLPACSHRFSASILIKVTNHIHFSFVGKFFPDSPLCEFNPQHSKHHSLSFPSDHLPSSNIHTCILLFHFLYYLSSPLD